MPDFDSFVVFAEMRTGSNLLEAALNQLEGVTCHGEAFNAQQLGTLGNRRLLGFTLAERDKNPLALWQKITAQPGLNGCRFFHDHDPRVLAPMLDDPRCAKIILTRNPVESYVSLKIARVTGQWRLGDGRDRKATQIDFDAAEFENHLVELQEFQIVLLRELQARGQTAFYIGYEDLQDLAAINGLAKWLGVPGRLKALPSDLVVQNPGAIRDKVTNYHVVAETLARLDRFNLSRTPNFEPRRGPALQRFLGSDAARLIYMPMPSPFDTVVRQWFLSLGPMREDFSQATLRDWKRQHPGHRGFTMCRHPLERVHLALAALLRRGDMADIRVALRDRYKMPLPKDGDRVAPEAWEPLLNAFMDWLKVNLNNQTNVRVALIWASQSAMIQGFSQFAAPDMVLRHERLGEGIEYLCRSVGCPVPEVPREENIAPVALADIWSPALEAKARDLYARDYDQFGYGDWRDL